MTPLSAMRGRLLGLPVWLWRGVLLHTGALFIVAWSAGPFLWQLSTSLQEDKALVAETPSWLPIPATLVHFVNIFTVKQFQLYLLNSVIVAGATTIVCLVLGALAAFALARLDIPTYSSCDLPNDLRAIPAVKPGSRGLNSGAQA